MRRFLVVLIAAAAFGGVVNVATADPGPSDSNRHGLCTAYFNGSANGRAHKSEAGPFVALMMAAANSDEVDNDGDGETDEGDETTGAEGVLSYCERLDAAPGGQPDDPSTEGDDGNGNKGGGKG